MKERVDALQQDEVMIQNLQSEIELLKKDLKWY